MGYPNPYFFIEIENYIHNVINYVFIFFESEEENNVNVKFSYE